MRMTKIKSSDDLGIFKDILELQVVDGNIEAITVRLGAEGEHSVRIVAGEVYNKYLQILTEERIEESRWRVSGTFMGLVEIDEVFKDEYEATQFKHKYLDKARYDEDCNLTITEFKVFVSGNRI